MSPRVARKLVYSTLAGSAWFFIELSFIFVLQGFLLALGIMDESQFALKEYFPSDLASNLLILVLYGVIRALGYVLKVFLANATGQEFLFEQRKKILSFVLENAQATSTKEMMSLFTETLNRVAEFFFHLSNLCNVSIAALFFFLSGLLLAPIEMCLGVALLAVCLMPMKILRSRIGREGDGLVKEWSLISESLVQGMRNFIFLKIYGISDHELQKGVGALANFKDHNNRFWKINSFNASLPMAVGVFSIAVITLVSQTYLSTPPLKLVGFFYVFIRLAQAGSEMNMSFGALKMHRSAMETVSNWHERMERVAQPAASIDSVTSSFEKLEVEVRDLEFSFGEEQSLFSHLSFRARLGDSIVIKGESGSGKSTLLMLILGLLVPKNGQVLINDVQVGKVSRLWRSQVSYVGPEPYLISGTLRENLVYGLSRRPTDDQLWSALQFAEVEDVVRKFSGGLEESISEVAQLSTGQKQRIAIARAYLRDVPVTILDEATANLDSETELRIVQKWMSRREKKLFLVVTHKDVFDSYATQIIKLRS